MKKLNLSLNSEEYKRLMKLLEFDTIDLKAANGLPFQKVKRNPTISNLILLNENILRKIKENK